MLFTSFHLRTVLFFQSPSIRLMQCIIHCAGLRASPGSTCYPSSDFCQCTHLVRLKRNHIFSLIFEKCSLKMCLYSATVRFPCIQHCAVHHSLRVPSFLFCSMIIISDWIFLFPSLPVECCQIIFLEPNSSYTWPWNNTGLNYEGPLTSGFFSILNTIVLQGSWMIELGMWNYGCGKTADVKDQL